MSRSALAPSAAKTCLHCDAQLSRSWRRTFGDAQQRAHRCPRCDTQRRINAGSAAGKDVQIPDPQDQPERFRGDRP